MLFIMGDQMLKIVCTMFVLATVILPQPVLAKSNIDKASDYAKIEKTSEARQLLNQAILDDPLDADVHYEAGLVYGQLGMSSDFDLGMKNACKLDNSYCSKVAEPYITKGFNYLSRGNQRSGVSSLEKAITYNPAKKQESLNSLLRSGKSQLEKGQMLNADIYLSALSQLDSSQNQTVSDLFYQFGLSSNIDGMLKAFRTASRYSKGNNAAMGSFLLEKANSNKDDERLLANLKKELPQYLSATEITAKFPITHIDLPPNEWYETKPLAKGEVSDVWIRGPRGYTTKIRMGSHDGKKYVVIMKNGEEINLKEGDRLPKRSNSYFKFKALEDNAICAARYDRL